MRCTIAAIGLGVVALAAPPDTTAAPIPEYRALYRATVNETAAGTSEFSLSYDSSGEKYTLTIKDVDERSRTYMTALEFDLADDGVRPLAYRQEKGRCVSCTYAVRFNWEEGRAEIKYQGTRLVVPVRRDKVAPKGLVFDLITMVAMLPGRRELAGFKGALSLESLGMVELATTVGPVHAEHLAYRGAKESDASDLWLARELGDVPVRIELSSGKSATMLELAELRGLALSPARGGPAAAE